MKILITTPLYPPEIAYIANYTKELASRFSSEHKVTVLTYANHPLRDNSFDLLFVKKDRNALQRLFNFTKILFKEVDRHDVVILQTGISAALPAFLISKIKSKKIVFRFFEDESIERKSIGTNNIKIIIIQIIQKIILRFSNIIIYPTPHQREILTNIYSEKNEKMRLVKEPNEKKIDLPFGDEEIPEKIKNTSYVQNIIKKGLGIGRISWEEHVEEMNKILRIL